jgi:hypothetical protein
MPYSGPNVVIRQRIPVPLDHVAVVAQKVGDLQLSSPQIADQRTMPAQGNLYIAARGGAVAAGTVLEFSFSNVPHYATWPRNLAIGLALLVLVGGAAAALRPGSARTGRSAERERLEARREKLFDELMALEAGHRERRVDPERYAERRRELVAALERVYLALDDEVAVGRAS